MLALRFSDYPVVSLRGFICGRASVTILKGFAETFRIIVNYYAFWSQFSKYTQIHTRRHVDGSVWTHKNGRVFWSDALKGDRPWNDVSIARNAVLTTAAVRSMISIWDNCTLWRCFFLLLCSVANDYANIAVEC